MLQRALPFCRTCDFFVQEEVDSRSEGQCRESSPQVVVVFDPKKEEHKLLTRWPVVKGGNGCGKHSDFFKKPI